MKKIFIYGDSEILKNYAEAVNMCGYKPYIGTELPYTADCCGLLLAGGGDINPSRYNQRRVHSYNIDMKRDEDELELIRLFTVTNRPILGICRGIQILNVAFGGTILQDVADTKKHKYDLKTGDQVHPVTAKEDSFLYRLYGKEFYVNSAHHQAIDRIGYGLHESAVSDDSIIEAVENTAKKIYAVQFHPERMAFGNRRGDTVDGRYIFDYFLKQCR